MPVHAKMIFSLVRKTLCIAMVHMSVGILQDIVVSAASVSGVSLMSILKAGDWARVSTPARHYF